MSEPDAALLGLQRCIDYRFADPSLARRALTHRSAASDNNERLEFLGDAILSFVIAEALHARVPEADEGDLSRLRALLVKGESLAKISNELGLGKWLKLGPGELKSGGHRRASILADVFEAVLGAVYLDAGMEVARAWVLRHYAERLDNLPPLDSLKDPKTRLQEWVQSRGQALPVYELVASSGQAHQRRFRVECRLKGQATTQAEAGSRRKAEQQAATIMLAQLEQALA